MRLAPVFPFTCFHYVLGLTGVPTLPYGVASPVGMTPATFAYVCIGYAAAHAATGSDSARTILRVVGAVAAIVVPVIVARIATRTIREAEVEEAAEG